MTEQLPDVQHRPDLVAGSLRGIAETNVAIRMSLAKAGLLVTGSALAALMLSLQPRADDATAASVESRDDDVHVTLDDLASDAVALLNEADGVARVERLVAAPKPRHRIIHIADWHTVPADFYAADLRDGSDHPLTDEEIKRAHALSGAVTKVVQVSQRTLLRWMGRYYGVRRVFVEGLTDRDLPAYLTLIRSVGRRGPDLLPPDFGAAAQAMLAGDIGELRAAEDEITSERARVEAVTHLVFDGPANDAREAAIVQRLVASGPLAVIVLGGDHDLSRHVRAIPDCEYLRVFVEGYPEQPTTSSSAVPLGFLILSRSIFSEPFRDTAKQCSRQWRGDLDGLRPTIIAIGPFAFLSSAFVKRFCHNSDRIQNLRSEPCFHLIRSAPLKK